MGDCEMKVSVGTYVGLNETRADAIKAWAELRDALENTTGEEEAPRLADAIEKLINARVRYILERERR